MLMSALVSDIKAKDEPFAKGSLCSPCAKGAETERLSWPVIVDFSSYDD
jgi:hypothetical protein